MLNTKVTSLFAYFHKKGGSGTLRNQRCISQGFKRVILLLKLDTKHNLHLQQQNSNWTPILRQWSATGHFWENENRIPVWLAQGSANCKAVSLLREWLLKWLCRVWSQLQLPQPMLPWEGTCLSMHGRDDCRSHVWSAQDSDWHSVAGSSKPYELFF